MCVAGAFNVGSENYVVELRLDLDTMIVNENRVVPFLKTTKLMNI